MVAFIKVPHHDWADFKHKDTMVKVTGWAQQLLAAPVKLGQHMPWELRMCAELFERDNLKFDLTFYQLNWP